MRKIIALLLLSLSLSTLSWAQLKSPITEQEAVARAWDIAVEQQLRSEDWVRFETSGAIFDGKEWFVLLNPKPNARGGVADGDHIIMFLTPDGKYIRLGIAM